MKLIQWKIIFLIILTASQVYGQEVISVFFEFGQSKIPENQLEQLSNIPVKYDLSDLDSVYFIGMADSVGSLKSNLKLSEKRAKNVARQCEHLFPKNIYSKTTAQGETTISEITNNRRVDIILYFKPRKLEPTEKEEIVEKKNVCYNIDYELLHRSHMRVVTKRKSEVIIETTHLDAKKLKEHYYGTNTKNKGFTAKKVKWSTKKTGNLWWAKTRYVTTIPKEDFETYKIFTFENPPCNSCNEDFQTQAAILHEDTCVQVDRFLMENIQVTSRFFRKEDIRIRVPKEYVNLEDDYFTDEFLLQKIVWQRKKGRKKQNYYYARIPRYFNYVSNITRVMNCCVNNVDSSGYYSPIWYCGTRSKPDRYYALNVEIGSNYQKSTIIPYIGIGISKERIYSRVSILLGTDINLGFTGALRFQYHILSFPFNALNPVSTWYSYSEPKTINRYGRIYLGTELRTNFSKTQLNLFEQNIHVGLAYVNTNKNALIPRIFVQYGLGYDYSGNNGSGMYSIMQLGLNIKIARLYKK